MMLGHVIGVKSSAIIALHELQAHVIAIRELGAAAIKMVKNAKFHGVSNRLLSIDSLCYIGLPHECGPVRLRSVVGASPMWHNAPPHWAHPAIRDT